MLPTARACSWLLAGSCAIIPARVLAAGFGELSCVEQEGNLLRYTCTAETPEASARITFWEQGSPEVRRTAWSDPGSVHSFTLWGLAPASTYEYRVELLDSYIIPGPVVRSFTTDALGAESLPPFADLGVRVSTRSGMDPWTEYVLLNLECRSSSQYLVILNQEGEIVWYQAPAAIGSVTGLHFTADQTIVAIYNDAQIQEWSLDGQLLRSRVYNCAGGSGPCPHHDVFTEGSEVWTLTGQVAEYPAVGLSGCEEKTGYVVDGIDRLDADLETVESFRMDIDFGYLPHEDMGPRFDPATPVPRCEASTWAGTLQWEDPASGGISEPIDYLHANALMWSGGALYLSSYAFHQIIKLDPTTRSVLWRLHGMEPDYSDFATPIAVAAGVVDSDETALNGMHHLSMLPDGRIQAYNNQRDAPMPSRVVRLAIDEKAAQVTLTEVFALVDDDGGSYVDPQPLSCDQVGSAYTLGDGSRVLANCGSAGTVSELDQPDGSMAAGPVWHMELSCAGSPLIAPSIYRALPIDSLDP